MEVEKSKSLSLEERTRKPQNLADEEPSLEKLEEALELLSEKVKHLAKKNGFSKQLKKKIALELI
jgi:hypothetical protein